VCVCVCVCVYVVASFPYIYYMSCNNLHICMFTHGCLHLCVCVARDVSLPFLDGYCSTVQGLLDWFEVDLGFTELLFIQIARMARDVSHTHTNASLHVRHLTLSSG